MKMIYRGSSYRKSLPLPAKLEERSLVYGGCRTTVI